MNYNERINSIVKIHPADRSSNEKHLVGIFKGVDSKTNIALVDLMLSDGSLRKNINFKLERIEF